ncbi:DUF5606 domain-containing protein [Mariniphaga sp.]|uniref:DUF5606 family protein n=1 Tax=Mariniphaga sp. TaxID=1954475 RepID=UPI00356B11C2
MLKGILSISGHQGLYKLVAESKNNIIVESLETGKRMPAYTTTKISALEDIAIYTDSADVPLKDVFKIIFEKENGGEALGHKESAEKLKTYFSEILPEYDRDRVYVSDIKKVLLWYNILQEKNMLDFSEEETEEPKENGEDGEKSSE